MEAELWPSAFEVSLPDSRVRTGGEEATGLTAPRAAGSGVRWDAGPSQVLVRLQPPGRPAPSLRILPSGSRAPRTLG